MLLHPELTTINDEAFLADDTLIGSYELGGGWLRVERVKIGKRAFVGNSGMAAAGPEGPEAVAGRGALGGPAPQEGQGRLVLAGQPARPAAPGQRHGRHQPHLRPAARGCGVARAAVELVGCVPVMASRRARRRPGRGALELLADRFGFLVAALLSGVVLMVAGLVAAAVTTAAKWLLVGRLRGGRPAALELVRVAQRAGGHLRRAASPRRGSPASRPAPPP